MEEPLSALLEPYGAYSEGVVDLRRDPTPEGISYLDLYHKDGQGSVPDGVVETRGEPLAYVVDRSASTQSAPDLPLLRKTLLLRGDAPYLAIVEPGRLTVFDTAWDQGVSNDPLLQVPKTEERARTTFHRLSVAPLRETGNRQYLHDLLFRLLNEAIEGLVERDVSWDDAVSLAGRALFLRFLIDRRVVGPGDVDRICSGTKHLQSLFTGWERVEKTCGWLDRTFNGDFLPLSFARRKGGFQLLGGKDALGPLENILFRAPGGQMLLDWGGLDFAHVPIGLLSQVYERQAEIWNPLSQSQDSVFYTPFRIAEFMVREVFAGLKEEGGAPHKVRILDPAAGGGVFLVSAFQEIVSAWWRHHGRPPNSREIREILYNQITGFEISEPAIRLSALSLYLKAIELDLDPHPPEKLQFEPLRGRVLHSVRAPREGTSRATLGSLGQGVSSSHRGTYDIVIGNPPWTSLKWTKAAYSKIVRAIQPIVEERLGSNAAEEFGIPDHLPDIPFLWRAMEWAKPGGWIAYALHGRLLFKGSEGGREARESLFRAFTVTGVFNGTDLRKTNVWPRITAHFCLLFAKNERPTLDHAFYFISPYREDHLNQQGRLRIDYQSAHPVDLKRLLARPELLKTLFRGTALDVPVMEKVQEKDWPSVSSYFEGTNGAGYQVVGKKNDPDFLSELKNLTTSYCGSVLVDPCQLQFFSEPTVHRRRKRDIYRGPLILVKKSPPLDASQQRALCCLSDIAYNESFYGYSAHGHREPEMLARYLVLLLHSSVFLWYVLVTSSQLGVERDTLLKKDVDDFPLRPLEDLPVELKEQIRPLSNALFASRSEVWPQLEAWSAQVYGLSTWDQEVVRDTLDVGLPYTHSLQESQRPPKNSEVMNFASRVERELLPFARAAGFALSACHLNGPEGAPWEVIAIEACDLEGRSPKKRGTVNLDELFQQADQEGASQILVVQPGGRRILLGILKQYRYWTQSRARLCALKILSEHLEALFGAQ